MILNPRAHQGELIDFHFRPDAKLGTLAWHGMGLGKTLSALWSARKQIKICRDHGIMDAKFLVVCPKSAVPTWKVECNRNTPDIYRDMVIYPYSQLHHAVKAMKYMNIRFIVWDESHYLKSPETGRIQTVAEFLRAVDVKTDGFKHGRMMFLTGTPFPNSAAELYTSWAMSCSPNLEEAAKRVTDPARYMDWKMTFSKKKEQVFKKGGRMRKANTYVGVANEEMLQQLLTPFVHFKRVEDCIDLPAMNPIYVDLNLSEDKLLADANLEEPEAYMALLERLSRAKCPYMMEWVDDFIDANQEQLVVFSMYRAPLEELAAKFPKHVRLITGTEKGADRAQNLKDFQEGKFRILAMTYRAGSESLNLQNACYSLYHGYPWHDGMLQQAIARTNRSGQLRPTQHYFLTSGENDMRILDIVIGKRENTKRIENILIANLESDKYIFKTLDELI